MAERQPDYARFARQMALPEVGRDGQLRLASVPVCFEGEAATLAASLHARAGGVVEEDASITVSLPASTGPSQALGTAALGAVEAARRVLGAPAEPLPLALLDRLR